MSMRKALIRQDKGNPCKTQHCIFQFLVTVEYRNLVRIWNSFKNSAFFASLNTDSIMKKKSRWNRHKRP